MVSPLKLVPISREVRVLQLFSFSSASVIFVNELFVIERKDKDLRLAMLGENWP